jgi:hypothetical protein
VEQSGSVSSHDDTRYQKARARVEELTRQHDRLVDAYQLGALSLQTFRDLVQRIEDSRRAAESALAVLKAEHLQAEVARGRASGAAHIIESLRPALLNADFETRQRIFRLIVERGVVTGHRLEIHLAIPVSLRGGISYRYSPLSVNGCARSSPRRRHMWTVARLTPYRAAMQSPEYPGRFKTATLAEFGERRAKRVFDS